MSSEKTVWHPPFTVLITERSPRWVGVTGEVRVAMELRLDDLLEVRADIVRDPNDRGTVLRGMWGFLVWVGLLEFKSISRPFRSGDLCRFMAYGFAWLASHKRADALRVSATETRAAGRDDVTLFLVVAAVSDALLAELADLGWALTPGASGYRPVTGAPLRLVVVDLSAAGAAERDDLMRWFAGVVESLSLDDRRWLTQHTGGKGAMKATPDLEGWDDWMVRYIAAMPPEQLLAHLKPEEVARALSEADHVLALPDAALRGLSADYLATLPEAAQQRIRERLGR